MSGRFDVKGRLVKRCNVEGCKNIACLSDDAILRKGRAGTWWCSQHFKEKQSDKGVLEKQETKTREAPKQVKQGRLF